MTFYCVECDTPLPDDSDILCASCSYYAAEPCCIAWVTSQCRDHVPDCPEGP